MIPARDLPDDLAREHRLPVTALLGLLRDRGLSLILSEAGPTLFGELLLRYELATSHREIGART